MILYNMRFVTHNSNCLKEFGVMIYRAASLLKSVILTSLSA